MLGAVRQVLGTLLKALAHAENHLTGSLRNVRLIDNKIGFWPACVRTSVADKQTRAYAYESHIRDPPQRRYESPRRSRRSNCDQYAFESVFEFCGNRRFRNMHPEAYWGSKSVDQAEGAQAQMGSPEQRFPWRSSTH